MLKILYKSLIRSTLKDYDFVIYENAKRQTLKKLDITGTLHSSPIYQA